MTREEAIKYLIKPVATSTEIGEEKQNELEAYNMAIEALTHECDTCIYNVCNYNRVPWESNGDLISRQAAVNVLIEGQDGSGQTYELIGELIDKVNALPSADREDYEKGYKDGQLAVMTGNDEKEFERGYRMGQAADRPTGEWLETESDEPCWYRCSECARRTDEASDYCPNCGAKME